MSSRAAHIRQARHNAALARELIDSGYRYRDWAVVAAFYAAVHYFEARLHDEPPFIHPAAIAPIRHTETSIPTAAGSGRYSPHRWRETLIAHNCSRATRNAYRELRAASEKARYHTDILVDTTAHDYFTPQEVDRLVATQLEAVKAGLGVS